MNGLYKVGFGQYPFYSTCNIGGKHLYYIKIYHLCQPPPPLSEGLNKSESLVNDQTWGRSSNQTFFAVNFLQSWNQYSEDINIFIHFTMLIYLKCNFLAIPKVNREKFLALTVECHLSILFLSLVCCWSHISAWIESMKEQAVDKCRKIWTETSLTNSS